MKTPQTHQDLDRMAFPILVLTVLVLGTFINASACDGVGPPLVTSCGILNSMCNVNPLCSPCMCVCVCVCAFVTVKTTYIQVSVC